MGGVWIGPPPRYEVIRARTLGLLEVEVRQWIMDGYVPIGGAVHVPAEADTDAVDDGGLGGEAGWAQTMCGPAVLAQ